MMRCGVIAVFACVSLPLAISQTTTLGPPQNEANTTPKPVSENNQIQLPPFSQLDHGLKSGPITIIDDKTFFITDLHYDGKGPDAHFWVGKGPSPSSSGILVPDENGSNATLSAYTGQNVTIRLPNNLTVDQIDYLGVWCIKFSSNFGHVSLRSTRRQVPQQEQLGVQLVPFKQLAHGLRSGPIIIVDKKTFFIPNLHYDGKGPDAHFWVGNGTEPSPKGRLVPDEKGSSESISGYSGQNIYITLPDGLTMDKIDYLGVWCIKFKHNFGHVAIPKNLTIPEATGNYLLTKDNKQIVRIQKCCPMNEVLRPGGCIAGNQDFDLAIDVHQHNSTHVDDEPMAAAAIRFAPFVNSINCEYNSYPLMPGADRFSLLQNGSLMILDTQRILSGDNYCMESIDFGDGKQSDWLTTALVCFSSGEVPTSNTTFFIYAVGITVSSVCLFITALVFLLVKEVRDARGKCVVAYSLSMAVAFICLAIAQFSGIDDKTCNIVGFVIQFFLVSSFTWLTMISWETFFKIRDAMLLENLEKLEILKRKHDSDAYTEDRKRLRWYFGIGISIPLVALIISLVVDLIPDIPSSILKPHFGKNSCFFDQKEGTMFYFYIPIAFAIVCNIVLAVLMKWKLMWFQKHRRTDISWLAIKMELKPMFRSCLFLLAIMTLCWVMEIVSFVVKSEGGVWIAIDVINSLQGLFVLVIFVLHRPVKDKICKVRRMHKRRIPNAEEKPMTPLKVNGTSSIANHNNHNNHNDFLTNLRHADSVEDMT